MSADSEATYDLGLVMAGAVSAGAYSAGVVDFLIQALDEWHRAKRERPDDVPTHEVRLKVIAGSSAGGMTGGIAAATLSGNHVPLTSLPGSEPSDSVRESNDLYSAWVEQIDIRPLLEDRDLSGAKGTVTSLLDSSILDEIAKTAVDFSPRNEKRAYVADPLHLLLTVTNLRGVPYDITFQGNRDIPHRTAQHTDYKEFVLSRTEPEEGIPLWLNPRDPASPEWDVLRQYALATGAFPGGLAPRALSRERSDYDKREWKVPVRPEGTTPTQCWKRTSIEPSWPERMRDEKAYRFLAVDGGAMNNEPFELAHQKLTGDDEFNARSPEDATRSILMVDPLPSERVTAGEQADDILSVLQGLFGSLLTQARFKPDELILANSPDVYSRFLIAPKRGDEKHPIASGMLGGFGGFLKKRFRMHDFQLGRRNCQRFLQEHLVIPREHCEKNPVFSHYSPGDLDDLLVRFSGENDNMMPIIPLVGSAQTEEFPLVWKTLRMSDGELNDLKTRIESRAKSVIDELVDQYVSGWFSKKIAGWIASNKRGEVVNRIMESIKSELREFDLKR